MLVLFVALTPGILFTIPGLGKNLRGNFVTAAMHAVLFVVIINFARLDVYEDFQAKQHHRTSVNYMPAPGPTDARVSPAQAAAAQAAEAARKAAGALRRSLYR